MKYQDYSAEDFALDDFFQAYVQQPNEKLVAFWEQWLEEHPEKAEEVQLARQIVESIQFKSEAVPLETIEQRIAGINQLIDAEAKPVKTMRNTISIRWAMGIAASLALLIASVFILQEQIFEEPSTLISAEVRYVTKEIPFGQKSTITLGDGTKVKLNSGSTFRFPETFSDSIREVYLTGEAFFEVAKNPDKPFVIHAQGVETRVLGTSFNIKAYPSIPNVSVAVATGKVRVNPANDKARAEVLIPNQMFVYNKPNDRAIKAEDINLTDLLAWKDKRIVFNKSLHEEIIETLERWYGVKFVVNKRLNTGTGYTAQFKPNESLEATLEHMKYSLGFNYKIDKNTITLN